jgi:hypothetical protein
MLKEGVEHLLPQGGAVDSIPYLQQARLDGDEFLELL